MKTLWKVQLGFLKGLMTLAWPWQVWVGLLVLANMIGPFFFFGHLEAKLVLGALMLGAVIQMVVFHAKGFVRLLGMGHLIVWTPLLPWLWTRLSTLGEVGPENPLALWLAVVIGLDAASWVIDLVDVVRYARGDREPSLTLADV